MQRSGQAMSRISRRLTLWRWRCRCSFRWPLHQAPYHCSPPRVSALGLKCRTARRLLTKLTHALSLYSPTSPPSAATSSFVSAIIREPLSGKQTPCPIGKSLDDPLLSQTGIWIASPSTSLENFVLARRIPASRFPAHSRTVQLPGFRVTVKEILQALGEVLQGGEEEVRKMVQFEDDETCRRIVASWPSEFDVSWAVKDLGFKVSGAGAVDDIRQEHQSGLKEAVGGGY